MSQEYIDNIPEQEVVLPYTGNPPRLHERVELEMYDEAHTVLTGLVIEVWTDRRRYAVRIVDERNRYDDLHRADLQRSTAQAGG